jgi:hypothetical protein
LGFYFGYLCVVGVYLVACHARPGATVVLSPS